MSDVAAEEFNYPIAIDLRDSWGLKRGPELLRRHIDDLGIDQSLYNATIRAVQSGCVTLLLDGFDEIGSQAWSNDSDKLRNIRAKSLDGVKDLISRTTTGVLIAGREHYFNSNEEMFSALGLDLEASLVVRCLDEFTEEQMQAFFERIDADIVLPEWLPRRPLICQTIADLSEEDLDQMFGVGEDETAFLNHFIRVLCIRDARIRASFDPETIESILIFLSRVTRSRSANVGPVTLVDVQSAFEAVIGQTPVEEAAVMLQRLPALGRVASESNDRQFIDVYILDGLRAKDVSRSIKSDDNTRRQVANMVFRNALDDLGQRILSVSLSEKPIDALRFIKLCLSHKNVVLACDVIASILRADLAEFGFDGAVVDDGAFVHFDMSKTRPVSLKIQNSTFGKLILPAAPPPQTMIEDCLAERIVGVASSSALPAWMRNVSADHFDSVESVSRIRKIGLDPRHEMLATIVRKTFFQKGAGRKEEALLRGLGQLGAPAASEKILNLLLRESVLTKFRGDQGWVYAPNRAMAGRMKKMLYELQVSQDPIWQAVGSL